jgi:YVTN family beta-propeller protein
VCVVESVCTEREYRLKQMSKTLGCILLGLVAIILGATSASATQFAYVTNFGSNTVSVIDQATKTVVATVPVGANPLGVALTPNGASAYVVNWSSGTVSVIATATNTVVTTIPVGVGPAGIAITPDGAFVYVSSWVHKGSPAALFR